MHLPDYEQLYDLLETRTGLTLDDNRRNDVARIVNDMLAAKKISGVLGLTQALMTYPFTNDLWQELLQTITVGETYFFRNKAHFNALRSHVFPALIARRREMGGKQLRLWSAGCATGEEPYSLAILLRELIPDIDTWQISILATDIDAASLERAQHGFYRAWSFRSETPESIRSSWFTQTDDSYELDRTIRNMVTFAPLNLAADDPVFQHGTIHMDLIICRNVTIYFDEATTHRLITRFRQVLNEEGWLVVGHAEPWPTTYREFTPRNFKNTVLYQKLAQTTVDITPPPAKPLPPPVTKPRIRREPLALLEKKLPLPSPRSSPPRQKEKPPQQQPPSLQQAEDTWQRAKSAADREDWDESLSWLAQIEENDVFQPHVHYLRALIWLQTEDFDNALLSLRQSIYCDPAFSLAHYTLGDLYDKLGEYKLAARHWRSAQKAIADLDPQQHLPLAEDLTVEMLQGLLAHRLSIL